MQKNENKIIEKSDVKYNFNLNIFEGPLDVLLYLARSSKIEITDISLDTLIDQYIEYIESVQDQGINVASEYIEMAAELIRLKSKTLIPGHDLEELEELVDGTFTREQLIAKLIEYKRYSDIAVQLGDLHALRPDYYYKVPSMMNELRTINYRNSFDVDRLMLAMQTVLITNQASVTETRLIETHELDVEGKVEQFRLLHSPISFELLIKKLDRLERISYFLGLLESVKLGHVHLQFDQEQIIIQPGAKIYE